MVAGGKDKTTHILHLSDLHFGADKNADPGDDAKRWFGQLADDLTRELGCQRLDALILSGDIGNFSEPEEYSAAELFVELVCQGFGLKAVQVVVVPGNHDLSWNLSKKGYRLLDEEDHDAPLKEGHFIRVSKDVIRLRDEAAYPQRFQHFRKFHETVTGASYSADPKTQITLNHLPGLNLVIVGFNSCWDVDHHFTKRVSINPDALAYALERLRKEETFRDCLKFAVWHHPLNSPNEDRIRDQGFMQWLASSGFSVCLHGHIHKADAGLYRYDMSPDGRKIHVIGAGTFGAPVREWHWGYPLQYNLLKLSGKELIVETRCRREISGAWMPDAIWPQGTGQDPAPRYSIELRTLLKPRPESPSELPQIDPKPAAHEMEAEIVSYCKKAEALYKDLHLAGFRTRLRVPIRIGDIYVPLRAMIDLRATGDACFPNALEAEKVLNTQGCGKEISLAEAFHEIEAMGRRGIVILGDPGSGKTTHLKRVLLWTIRGGFKDLGLPRDIVPVFLPLRKLKTLDRGLDAFIEEQLDNPHFGTPHGFGKKLLARGNLLFLFDGLDEVSEADHRMKVSQWIEEALKIHDSCRFVITSRFAGYTPQTRLDEHFIEMHMRPLTAEQAEEFIRNWYLIVERGISSDRDQAEILARNKSSDLIKRLSSPEFRARRVFELTCNPLLLTNLCLVHRDRGDLPKSRARLYEECTDVLLELWHGAMKIPSRVTAQSGRQILQPVALWLHQKKNRTLAKASELAPIIEPALKSAGWTHGGTEDFLKAVRDESGLLTGWDQEHYGFMHLGFQEYLAAREIQNRVLKDSEVLRELAARFGDPWWQEVILLMLALENPALFEPFMREVVKKPDFASHADLVEMCLDDTVEKSPQPFLDLLRKKARNDPHLWKAQLTALHILDRLDKEALEPILPTLRSHPYEMIRKWAQERGKHGRQDVIVSERGGYELVRIPGGRFLMGSKEYDEESPVQEVKIPDFYMGRYPVTNAEYGRFLTENRKASQPGYWGDRKFNQPSQPVVGISWEDARRYARWAGLRLPSEAEWEYACRAGTTTRYYTGDKEKHLDRAGWYGDNSGSKLHPVGEKEPNAFGLYDMHGNVWEWVEDDWHKSYEGSPCDGRAWVDNPRGSDRVLRGGSWLNPARNCRSACRFGNVPGDRGEGIGFRLVFFPGQQQEQAGQAKGNERNGG